MTKLVYGVGISDVPFSAGTPLYTAWYGMLTRCYSIAYKTKYPTYADCTVCEEWFRFSTFSRWAEQFQHEGMELDKDILIPGNKHYSPDLCVFIPSWLNIFFSNMQPKRRALPMGVNRISINRYCARFGCRGSYVYLGSFKTPELAHSAYMAHRKIEAQKRIKTYREAGHADLRVIAALVQFFLADESAVSVNRTSLPGYGSVAR